MADRQIRPAEATHAIVRQLKDGQIPVNQSVLHDTLQNFASRLPLAGLQDFPTPGERVLALDGIAISVGLVLEPDPAERASNAAIRTAETITYLTTILSTTQRLSEQPDNPMVNNFINALEDIRTSSSDSLNITLRRSNEITTIQRTQELVQIAATALDLNVAQGRLNEAVLVGLNFLMPDLKQPPTFSDVIIDTIVQNARNDNWTHIVKQAENVIGMARQNFFAFQDGLRAAVADKALQVANNRNSLGNPIARKYGDSLYASLSNNNISVPSTALASIQESVIRTTAIVTLLTNAYRPSNQNIMEQSDQPLTQIPIMEGRINPTEIPNFVDLLKFLSTNVQKLFPSAIHPLIEKIIIQTLHFIADQNMWSGNDWEGGSSGSSGNRRGPGPQGGDKTPILT